MDFSKYNQNFEEKFYDSFRGSDAEEENQEEQEKITVRENFKCSDNLNKTQYYKMRKEWEKYSRLLDDAKINNYSRETQSRYERQIKNIAEKLDRIGIDQNIKNQINDHIKTLFDNRESGAPIPDDILDEEWQNNFEYGAQGLSQLLEDLINRLGSDKLKKFVKKHCVFEINDDKNSTGVEMEKLTNEINIKIGYKTLYEEGMEYKDAHNKMRKYMITRPDRVSFVFGQTIGALLQEPDGWQEIAEKYKIETKITDSLNTTWEDFCGLCMSMPGEAEEVCKPAYKLFMDRLEQIDANKALQAAEKKKTIAGKEITYKGEVHNQEEYNNTEKFWKDANQLNGILFMFKFIRGMASKQYREYWYEHQTFMPKSVGMSRALASFEDKEVSEILLRNDFVGARYEQLKFLLGNGERIVSFNNAISIRAMATALCKTGDFYEPLLYMVLQATDELYCKTHGEMITEESYYFVSRARRISGAGRIGTKPIEYDVIRPGKVYQIFNADTHAWESHVSTKTEYVRKKYKDYEQEVLEELKDMNIRNVSKIAKEGFDTLKDADGNFYELDEESIKFSTDKDDCYLGNLKEFMPDGFGEKMFKNFNFRNDRKKINMDIISILAYLIATEAIKDNPEDAKKYGVMFTGGKSAMGTDYTRPFIGEAYNFYKPQFCENPEYRKYVNFFLKRFGVQVIGFDGEKAKLGPYDVTTDSFIDQDKSKMEAKVVDDVFYKNPDLRNADDLDNEFSKLYQSEEIGDPKEQTDAFKIPEKVDSTNNDLFDKFYVDRKSETAAENIASIEAGLETCKNVLEDIINDMDIDDRVKKIIRKLTFADNCDPDDIDLLNSPHIIDNIFQEIAADKEINFSEKELDQLEEKLDKAFIRFRPIRKKYIAFRSLKKDLGYNDYFEKISYETTKKTLKEAIKNVSKEDEIKTKKESATEEYKQKIQIVRSDIANLVKAQEKINKSKDENEKKVCNQEIVALIDKIKEKQENKDQIPDREYEKIDKLADLDVRAQDQAMQMIRTLKMLEAILNYCNFDCRQIYEQRIEEIKANKSKGSKDNGGSE